MARRDELPDHRQEDAKRDWAKIQASSKAVLSGVRLYVSGAETIAGVAFCMVSENEAMKAKLNDAVRLNRVLSKRVANLERELAKRRPLGGA